jgi:hypothetical protein
MIVVRRHLIDYHRASPTPALDYGSDYFLMGVFWSTPTDAPPSCVTNTEIFGQARTTFPSHPPYDLQSLRIMQPRIDQVMSGFPRLFSDVPYIAQCVGAARGSRRPGYLSRASFLTSTQAVIRTGAVQKPAPPSATFAQPPDAPDSPVSSSVGSLVAASKIQGPISAAHGRSMEPAQPPTRTEPGTSPPSMVATNMAPTADGNPSATVTALGSSNTIDFDQYRPPIYITPAPGIIATPTNVPIVIINGQTLIPGASSPRTITIMNTPLHASGSFIIYGTSTIPISAIASAIPQLSASISQASALVISSQTLMPGGSAVTLGSGSGTTTILSLESGGPSMLVVSESQGATSVSVEWPSGVVGQGLSESGTASQTPTIQMYTGSAARVDSCIGMIVRIVIAIVCYRVLA